MQNFRISIISIKKVSKRNIFTTDQSFQNHYKKIASHDVHILFEIGQYNANIPKNQNESMGLFMNKIRCAPGILLGQKTKHSI